jgi:hypothetical protein
MGIPCATCGPAGKPVLAHLPIDGHATAVTLMTQQAAGGQWTKSASFCLA